MPSWFCLNGLRMKVSLGNSPMKEAELERMLATIIANTRTKNRSISLVALSRYLHSAKKHFGTLAALGEQVGLSGKMLGQFLMVDRLVSPVLELVDARKIDSVDAVAHISQLNCIDQQEVARRVLNDGWSTADIRAFVEARKYDREFDSASLAEKVSLARSEKQFVFEFIVRGSLDTRTVKEKLADSLPTNSVVSINIKGTRGELVVTSSGYEALQAVAKRKRVPLRLVLPQIIYT